MRTSPLLRSHPRSGPRSIFKILGALLLALLLPVKLAMAEPKLDLFGILTGLSAKDLTVLAGQKHWTCQTFWDEFEVICLIQDGVIIVHLAPYLSGNPVYRVTFSAAAAEARTGLIAFLSELYGTKPENYDGGQTFITWQLNSITSLRLIESSRIELLNQGILDSEIAIQKEVILKKQAENGVRNSPK